MHKNKKSEHIEKSFAKGLNKNYDFMNDFSSILDGHQDKGGTWFNPNKKSKGCC